MSDNPFSEPDDSDRTVLRPVPGGRRAAPPQPAPSPAFRDTPPPARTAAPIPAEGAETHQLRPQPADRGRRAAAATPWPPAQHLQPAGSRRSARARDPADPRLRAGGARCRHPAGSASPRALRAVRQPRRRGAEHPLGQQRRLGGALAGLDLPPGGAQRRALLRSAQPAPAEPRHLPAGAGADVSLPQPRLPGPLSPVAARTR